MLTSQNRWITKTGLLTHQPGIDINCNRACVLGRVRSLSAGLMYWLSGIFELGVAFSPMCRHVKNWDLSTWTWNRTISWNDYPLRYARHIQKLDVMRECYDFDWDSIQSSSRCKLGQDKLNKLVKWLDRDVSPDKLNKILIWTGE